ncbi:hypothetical protein [Microbulbifer taiwanensis]|uniref:Uncharacterized protein n=1 Tax=Microbulbifer taiwanensis TaxID=986746 RepID=A0ABW1YNT1_9GAMM|nr:hypothetical protein [Microbulbifer taiwanensis]
MGRMAVEATLAAFWYIFVKPTRMCGYWRTSGNYAAAVDMAATQYFNRRARNLFGCGNHRAEKGKDFPAYARRAK